MTLAETQVAWERAVAERARARAELDQTRVARARAYDEGVDPDVLDAARKEQALAFRAYFVAYEAERRAREKARYAARARSKDGA